MKAIPVQETQGQLGQLIAEACRGEVIVLADGDKKVTLEPGVPLDLEGDSQELKAQLARMAADPQIRKELSDINEEFAAAEADGLRSP